MKRPVKSNFGKASDKRTSSQRGSLVFHPFTGEGGVGGGGKKAVKGTFKKVFEYLDRSQRKPNLTQMFRLAAAQSAEEGKEKETRLTSVTLKSLMKNHRR